jgi:hypothetical protein
MSIACGRAAKPRQEVAPSVRAEKKAPHFFNGLSSDNSAAAGPKHDHPSVAGQFSVQMPDTHHIPIDAALVP